MLAADLPEPFTLVARCLALDVVAAGFASAEVQTFMAAWPEVARLRPVVIRCPAVTGADGALAVMLVVDRDAVHACAPLRLLPMALPLCSPSARLSPRR